MTKRTSVRLTLQQAKVILLAKAIEESNDAAIGWTQANAEAASLRAAHTVGEGADPVKLLTERAKIVLRETAERGINTKLSTKARLPKFFSPLFILLAFVLGGLTDRIVSPEHIVNLLSPPYWTVILWNLLVYCALFCCAIGLVETSSNHFALPLRSSLIAFVEKASFSTLRRKGYKAHFYAEWTQFVSPLVRMHVARTLHFSALAFALGIVASLLVRGFGTAYWAGWESTWLAESPESVKTFIDYTYGLIPAVGPLTPMPDLATVAEMRADRLPYLETPISAAPWLMRMMILISVTVIIPRLVFTVFDTWRMRRFKANSTLAIDAPYFGNILEQCAQDAVIGNLVVIKSTTNRPERDANVALFCRHWGEADDSCIHAVDFNDEEASLPALTHSIRKPVVLIWFDGMETPEEDVHGALIDRAHSDYEEKNAAVVAALVDLKEFSTRFASIPERIKERENTWTNFCKSRNVSIFLTTGTSESQLENIKALRAWAAPRITTRQVSMTDVKEKKQ